MAKYRGFLYAIASAIAFGLMPILAKIAYIGGANAITVIFLRFFIAALILLGYFILQRVNIKITKQQLKKVILLGLVWYMATCLTLFISYEYISVGLATVFHFIYPAVVTFLSYLVYKEHLYPNKIVSVVLSLLGVLVLVGFTSIKLSYKGIILALASGIFYSFYIVEVGDKEIKSMDTLVLTFYVSFFASLGILPLGIVTKSLYLKMQFASILAIVLLAVISTIIGLITFARSVKIIGPSSAAIFSTLEPITSIVLGVIFLKESMSLSLVMGTCLIVASILILLRNERKISAI